MGRFIRNSYNAGDQVNRFPWQVAQGLEALTQAVGDFIAFRRSEPLLGLTTKAEVEASYRPLPNLPSGCLGFALHPSLDSETVPPAQEKSTLVVVVNLGEESQEIPAKVFDALGLISRRMGTEPRVVLDIWGKPEDGGRKPDGITVTSDRAIHLLALSGGVIII
jgi:hypothetical protein